MCIDGKNCEKIQEIMDTIHLIHEGKNRGFFVVGIVNGDGPNDITASQVMGNIHSLRGIELLESVVTWLEHNKFTRPMQIEYLAKTLRVPVSSTADMTEKI